MSFVAPGDSVAENERDRFGIACQVIPNWVDSSVTDALDPAIREGARVRLELGESDVAVVSVGNCGSAKRHPILIRALANLAEEGVELTYLHAGEEEPGRPEWWLARELGLEGRARFLGPVRNVAELLAAADVFVMPSEYEGFGVAAIEGLVAGLPVVLTDVPGLRDHRATFGEIEWANGSVASLAEAVRRAVAKAASFRDGAGQAQAERAAAMFSPERGAQAYASIYRRVLGVA